MKPEQKRYEADHRRYKEKAMERYSATTGSFMKNEQEKTGTICARDYKDPQIVKEEYRVQRLTPTECARLQGFPDRWCRDLETPNPTDEEVEFWIEVWGKWNEKNGKKPKTASQVRKWLSSPHTDGAEYRAWGNGVALPCVYFVMMGIANQQ